MTARVCILTPDPGDPDHAGRWPDVLARHREAMASAGLAVESRSWTAAEGLDGFDLVMPLLVWGYPRAHSRWLAAVEAWERAGVRIHNPASVLRWNSDKSYLARLAEAGAPVVPTLFAERLSEEVLAQAVEQFGTPRLVGKPRVSASAWRTVRWSPGEPFDAGPDGAAMVQPYLPDIERAGEMSLIYFEGRFSHAISKRPQPGDFRVQPEYDGIIAACRPRPDDHEAAERVLAAAGERLLYARVDLVRGLDGAPRLIELELIEPDLYLGYDEGAARRFGAAARELIRA